MPAASSVSSNMTPTFRSRPERSLGRIRVPNRFQISGGMSPGMRNDFRTDGSGDTGAGESARVSGPGPKPVEPPAGPLQQAFPRRRSLRFLGSRRAQSLSQVPCQQVDVRLKHDVLGQDGLPERHATETAIRSSSGGEPKVPSADELDDLSAQHSVGIDQTRQCGTRPRRPTRSASRIPLFDIVTRFLRCDPPHDRADPSNARPGGIGTPFRTAPVQLAPLPVPARSGQTVAFRSPPGGGTPPGKFAAAGGVRLAAAHRRANDTHADHSLREKLSTKEIMRTAISPAQ